MDWCTWNQKIGVLNRVLQLLIVFVAQSFAWQLDLSELALEELRDTFGTYQPEKVPPHHLFIPETRTDAVGSLKYFSLNLPRKTHFPYEDLTDVSLTFFPVDSELFAQQYTVVYRDGQDKSNSSTRGTSLNYKGLILDPQGIYVIHPAPERHQLRYKRATPSSQQQGYGLHVIYRRQTTSANHAQQNPTKTSTTNVTTTTGVEHGGHFCYLEIPNEASEDIETESESGEEFEVEDVFVLDSSWGSVYSRLSKRDDLTIELALFVDENLWKKFYEKHGGYAEQKLQDYVVTVFNNIQLMYQSPTITPKISFKIVHYEVFKTQPSELHYGYHSSGNAQKYLDSFCKYQARLRNHNRWDHAFLMSGLNLHKGYRSDSISGIARLHGMCDNENTCTLTEGLDFTSVFIGTHELGHSVGMRHDEPYCESNYIMSSSLGPGKVTWSTCSIRDYRKFMQRLDRRGKNCLKHAKKSEVINRETVLPGQKFSADMQCELMHGQGYKQVAPDHDHVEGICHMMWCGLNGFGRIITSHPALEGTFCGHNQWCLEGRCVQWSSLPSAQPQERNQKPDMNNFGHITFGSYTNVKRTCTNPAPRNGGQHCTGSKVRGIVCRKDCSRQTDSVKAYMGRLCAAHKHRPSNHELTGAGAQLLKYSSRACKVFCVIKNSRNARNYRFLGDYLPDGTECGWNSYCVAGECLPLSCGDKALTKRSSSDCPHAGEMCSIAEPLPTTTLPKIPSEWQPWGPWSHCSVSCGAGYRTRTRHCRRGTDDSICAGGENQQTKVCNAGFCQWQAWGACSQSCGGGRQTRVRYCPGGGCQGSGKQSQTCNTMKCIMWSSWGPWSACSKTCGLATKRRTRKCGGPDCARHSNGEDIEVEDCIPKYCPWQPWGPCSVSCGQGSRERFRTCPGSGCYSEPWDRVGGNREVDVCDQGLCPEAEWSEWTSWTGCSTSCGGGLAARYRRCEWEAGSEKDGQAPVCKQGKDSQKRKCNTKPCGAWSQWSEFSSCSVSCGGSGIKQRNRSCLGGGECMGSDLESVECGTKPCGAWSQWSEFSSCSVSCGGSGIKQRSRSCLGGAACAGSDTDIVKCGTKSCGVWNEWSEYSPCSVACGGRGIKQRTRYNGPCNQANIGSCLGGSDCVGSDAESAVCGTEPCGLWSLWSSWSFCSETCGGFGKKKRNRACINGATCAGPSFEVQQCGNEPCGVWQSWMPWSVCSVTCGGRGKRKRKRLCRGGTCSSFNSETEECSSNVPCGSDVPEQRSFSKGVWTPWGVWGECTATCGKGLRTRLRVCVKGHCEGSGLDSESCFKQYCEGFGWTTWSIWTPCSKTCGKGTRSRGRLCTSQQCNDRGNQFSTCNEQPCPVGPPEPEKLSEDKQPMPNEGTWGSWGAWSVCSAGCNWGIQSRARNCYDGPTCTGSRFEERGCEMPPCATWGAWGQWSGCSKTCGGGVESRLRNCYGKGQCLGEATEEVSCATQRCSGVRRK